jgi:hypothetical protein
MKSQTQGVSLTGFFLVPLRKQIRAVDNTVEPFFASLFRLYINAAVIVNEPKRLPLHANDKSSNVCRVDQRCRGKNESPHA